MAKILYFAALVDQIGRDSEIVALPISVIDVRSLLTWLRTRGGNWERLLMEQAVRVTVNKQFAAPETVVNDAAEIAIISMRPG